MLEYFDKLRFHCCSCNACVEWGQTQCPQCHTQIVKGMSAPLDRLLSIGLYVLIVAGLAIGILVINQNLLAGAISFAGVVGIAIVVAAIKFNIRLGMRLNPKHAEVKLELLPIRSNAYWKTEIYEFRPERWTKANPDYKSIYDLFQDGLSLTDTVKILDHFPDDKALDFLEHTVMTGGDDLIPYCVRSLIRIGNKRAISILLFVLSEDRLKRFKEKTDIFLSEDLERLTTVLDEILASKKPVSNAEQQAPSSPQIKCETSPLSKATIEEFWMLTWKERRQGILSPFARELTHEDFTQFMRKSRDVTAGGVKHCVRTLDLYRGEFLFTFNNYGVPRRLYLFLTNYRLLIRSRRKDPFTEIWLRDIDTISPSVTFFHAKVEIRKKDGTVLVFDQPQGVPITTMCDLALTANRKPNLISDPSENTRK